MKATIYKMKKSTRDAKHPPRLEPELETEVSAELHAEVLAAELQKRLNKAGPDKYVCGYFLHPEPVEEPESDAA